LEAHHLQEVPYQQLAAEVGRPDPGEGRGVAATSICFPFASDIPVGGGHPSAMLLIRHLDPQRFRPILVLHGPAGPAGRWLAEQGADLPTLRLARYAGGLRRNLMRDAGRVVLESRCLARLLRQEDVRIVHANDIWMLGTWAAASKLAGAKLIWHHRSSARYGSIHRIGFRAADKMIAVSAFAAGKRAQSSKCTIIADPFEVGTATLDRARRRQALLNELDLSEPVVLLGFFANLNRPVSWRKRPLVVIRALAEMKQRRPHLRVVALLFGEVSVEIRQAIEAEVARLEVQGRVFMPGFRSPAEDYLAVSDVVLAPAVDEGFGRVLIEGMLVGTPIVASASGNHPALIDDGKTGMLVPPDNPAALAEQILLLLDQPALRARITRQAREESLRRFAAAASARAVMAVYDQLLVQARPVPAGAIQEGRV
jgi:glycosyltransferase involved in cell wall biosynthesis